MLTKEKYIKSKREGQLNVEELFEFYQKADHDKEKIDFETFQQAMSHYLSMNMDMSKYFRYYDHLFNIMYLKHDGKVMIV